MDPTKDQQPALTRAIAIAKKFDASVDLFLTGYHKGLISNWFWNEKELENLKAEYLKSKRRWLDTYVKELQEQGIRVTSDIQWNKAVYKSIINKAKESNADLVIKSTHQHPKIQKILFSPNDWQLIKACPMPVLLVKEDVSRDYSQVMAAIDPTHSRGKPKGLDKVILDTATDIANRFEANSRVTHCFQAMNAELWQGLSINPVGSKNAIYSYDEYLKQFRSHISELFVNAISSYQFDERNQHLEAGDARDVLPRLTKSNDVDLLILGTTYKTGLLGNTAEAILDDINCDILTVKMDCAKSAEEEMEGCCL